MILLRSVLVVVNTFKLHMKIQKYNSEKICPLKDNIFVGMTIQVDSCVNQIIACTNKTQETEKLKMQISKAMM